MSQLGMQLPGSQTRRSASVNVYTALLLVAVLCLGAATGVVFVNGAKVAPDGQPWKVHPDQGELKFKQ